jgi:DNA-binding transcriptional MerR regulator
MQQYKIGDVAGILGISTDLIRYYEERGIVKPKKDASNNYRYYDAWDINFLIDCLWYKNFGFGIDEIAMMTTAESRDMLIKRLTEKGDEILMSLRRQGMLLERIRGHSENVARIKDYIGRCDLRDCKEHIYYLNRFNHAYDNGPQLRTLNRAWSKYMPFTKRYFEVKKDDLLGKGSDYAWGFSMGMKYVEAFNIPVTAPVVHKKPQLCVHSAFKSSGKDAFTARRLDFMRDFALKNRLVVSDRAFGNLVCSVLDEEKGAITGYFEAWLPVEKTE